MACVRPDHGAVTVYRGDANGVHVIRDDKFPSAARWMVCAEKKTGQRVRVDMALEPHRFTALDVKDYPIPVVIGGQDSFCAHLAR
jgi:hypothetical protein